MTDLRAVLFDFGGTLCNYGRLESAERDRLTDAISRSRSIATAT